MLMSEINRADLWVGLSLSVCVTAEMSLNKSNIVRKVNHTSWSKREKIADILYHFWHRIYIRHMSTYIYADLHETVKVSELFLISRSGCKSVQMACFFIAAYVHG